MATEIDPAAILRRLIRFDTTNPPGNERACVRWVAELLTSAGIEVRLLGAEAERPNLVARVPGRGLAPPLLLQAHVDVVPTQGQSWSHPPFEGLEIDGHVWGRGALDMKGGLAMMLSALLRARARGADPAGEVILAVLADEEAGGTLGAHFLVERHPELFAGVRHAIGEDGGTALGVGGLRFQPIVVAEKRACWLRATLRGSGGHASLAAPEGTAMGKLARMLTGIDRQRFPVHSIPVVERMLAELAGTLPESLAELVTAPWDGRSPEDGQFGAGGDGHDRGDGARRLAPRDRAYLESVRRHTVNATIVRGGSKINVLPSEITVDLDGRMLPGFEVEEFLDELRALVGDDAELEILYEGQRMPEPETGPFYELLAGIVRERDPDCVPLPMLTTGATDARHFARLGIRGYGWLPLRLPSGAAYQETLHAADERVPVAALHFGTDCLNDLLEQYR
jgi:acetylornithine deacetylase/succinyl-diaminopimelate desuccinylase-like protein